MLTLEACMRAYAQPERALSPQARRALEALSPRKTEGKTEGSKTQERKIRVVKEAK